MKLFGGKTLHVVISLILLGALGFLVDWPLMLDHLHGADPLWLLAAAAMVLLARLAMSLRWMILLHQAGRTPKLQQVFYIVSTGIGIGSLIPTSLGPDLARGALLGRHEHAAHGEAHVGRVVSSLAMDRAIGVLGTCFVALVASIAWGLWSIALPMAALLAVVGAVIVLGLRHGADKVLALVQKRFPKLQGRLLDVLARFVDPQFLRNGFLAALLMSFVVTLMRCLMFVFLYRALGQPVPMGYAMVMIPLLLIAMVMPISIGGLGLREWVLVIGFQGIGISPAVSVTVGLLSFALQLIVSLPWIAAYMAGWGMQTKRSALAGND